MSISWNTSQTQYVHTRTHKRTYFIIGTILSLSISLFAVTTSFSSQLFPDRPLRNTELQARATNLDRVNKSAPLPILMSSTVTAPSRVHVKGIEITKSATASGSGIIVPSTMLSNNYIRSFIFHTENSIEGTIVSASWNTKNISKPNLYIVYEKLGSQDKELFSVYGSDLESATKSFIINHDPQELYLKVVTFNEKGDEEVLATSPVVTASQ